jgi:hypothetical protein
VFARACWTISHRDDGPSIRTEHGSWGVALNLIRTRRAPTVDVKFSKNFRVIAAAARRHAGDRYWCVVFMSDVLDELREFAEVQSHAGILDRENPSYKHSIFSTSTPEMPNNGWISPLGRLHLHMSKYGHIRY